MNNLSLNSSGGHAFVNMVQYDLSYGVFLDDMYTALGTMARPIPNRVSEQLLQITPLRTGP